MPRQHTPFAPGPLEDARLEILEVYAERTWKTSRYRVRYPCCGDEGVIQHQSVLRRISSGAERCPRCTRSASSLLRAQRYWLTKRGPLSARPRRGLLGLIDRYWPRPLSLVGTAPGVWGARP